MVSPLYSEVAEKVQIIRDILSDDDALYSLAEFPPGIDLNASMALASYREAFALPDRSDEVADINLDNLNLPVGLVELYQISDSPMAGGIEFYSESQLTKGSVLDAEGIPCSIQEHWLRFALVANDNFLVSLTDGRVMYSDHSAWRYGSTNSSRIVSSDVLSFVNEYMLGPKYLEFEPTHGLEEVYGWYRFLREHSLV
ncbi:hypothetical protein [Nocardia sp. CC227C]|uniref:hypothetical protein n=1 Tax=Nocardia sp. CC227C TaxID=3044562 RepID=UPI00278C8FEE|nr:hypothetical protein [Nocardia sp. CC227C]